MFNWSQWTGLQVDDPSDGRFSIEFHTSLKTYNLVYILDFLNLPNVPLADKDTGMMDALGKAELEDLSLQPPLQEILNLQTQNVIELHLALIQHTNPHETSEQGITLGEKKEPFTVSTKVVQAVCRKPEICLIDEEFVTSQKSDNW